MAGTSVSNGSSAWVVNNASIQSVMDELGEALTQISAEPSVLDGLLSRFWSSYHALKHRQQDSRLSVAVLALAKSGKSTLLNALVGQELLPMNNVPETARISKIVHTLDAKEPYLVEYATANSGGKAPDTQGNVTARGEAGVRQRLQQLNQAVRERSGPLSSLRSQPSHGLPSVPSLGVPRSPSLAMTHSAAVAGSPSVQAQLAGAGAGSGAGSGEGLAGSGSGSLEEGAHGEEDPAGVDVSALDLPSPSCPPVATGLPLDRLLTIHAPVAALVEYDHSHAAGSSEGGAAVGGAVRLQLLDTPGPNEAGEEELKHQVERLLDGVDAVLYLLDYTKLKTQDEAGMFERLRAINPALVSRLSQRLFFVINKVDAALTSEGQDLEQTREYVAELVTQQMGLEGFSLKPDQVLLLSARNALLSRLVLSGKASPESRARFVQLAFGRFANPACITQELMHTAANALLMDSGVLDVESQVLAYLYNHAAAVKQLALVDDLGRLLVEVGNVARSCTAALSASAEALAARVTEVRAQLAATLAQFEAVQKDADNIAKEVSREVSAHLHLLRGRLFSAIINALDTSGGPDMPAPSHPAAGAGLMTRGWQTVRERFLSIFTGRAATGGGPATNISSGVAYFSSEGGVAGAREDPLDRCDSAALLNAAGGMVARSRSKAELASLLLTLHEELTGQIHAEVREFWGVMEAVAAARHAELLTTLNTHLADLARQVEGAVSHSLEVRLRPVQLTLAPPDAAQFHANIDTLLARGVAETRERHIRVNQKEVVERVLRRGGICRWGDYWESVPRVRTVVEAYTLSVFELVPSEISQHFITMVDSAIDGTQASLEGYVSQFVGQQLQEAREQLQAYSHSYLGVMSTALEASTQGSQQRLNALAQVRTFTTKVNTVQIQFNNLQHQLSHGVPRALDVMSAYDELSDVCELEEEQQEAEEAEQQLQEQREEQEGGDDGATAAEDQPAPTTLPSPTAAAAGTHEEQAEDIASTSMKTASPFAQAAVAAQVFDTAAAPTSCMDAGDAGAAGAPVPPAPAAEQPSRAASDVAGVRAASAGSGTLPAADSPLPAEPRSPTSQSDSSSLVNALLQAPLGASPQRVPRTPATPALSADMDDPPPAADSAGESHLSGGPAQESSPTDPANEPAAAAAPSSSAISLPSGPFDYASGFINAMSGSQVQVEPAEGAAAAAGVVARAVSVSGSSTEEWDLVDQVEGEEHAAAA